MKELQKLDHAKVIKKIATQLNVVSKLYGFADPDNHGATGLTKFIAKNYLNMIEEIETAFELSALGKLNVKIESYGKTLTIPIIASVLNEYRKKKNMENRNQIPAPRPESLNIKARLETLVNLELYPDCKIRMYHYDFIDKWIQVFEDQLKIDKMDEVLKRERKRIDKIVAMTKKEHIAIQDQQRNLIPNSKMIAKTELAEDFIKNNVINSEEVEARIRSNQPLK